MLIACQTEEPAPKRPTAYAHDRGAVLRWPAGPQPAQDTLKQMEAGLSRAVQMNPAFADAPARLAEVRAALGQPASEVMPAIARAVELEPSSVWHRLISSMTPPK